MTTQEQDTARFQRVILFILVAAAALRFWYLFAIMDAPDFTSLRQDMSVQDYQARAMLSGDWTVPEGRSDPEIPTTPYYRPPGYAYLLAVIYFFSGGSYLAPRLFNIALGMISILLTAHLARILFSRGVALITAFIMATYWGFIYYEGEVNDPAVFVFLLPCLLLTLHRWGMTRMARWAALAGIITGCYALMRPNILMYGPIMAAWMLYLEWRSGSLLRTWRAWVSLAGATALVIMPVTLRNYVVSGEFVPISTYFGENLLIGNCEYADGYTSWTPYLQELEGTGQFSVWEYANIVHGLGREIGNENITHSEASRIFAQKAVDWIQKNKMTTLRLALKKAVLFWSPWEITENKVVHYEKAHYPPLKYMPGFPYLFALFLAGVVLMCRDRFFRTGGWETFKATGSQCFGEAGKKSVSTGDMLLLLHSLLLCYYFSFLPFFVNARARHPITGLMALIAAYGIYRIWQAWQRKRLVTVAVSLLLLLACFGLARWEPYSYTPDKARWHYARADSWLRSGEVDKAAVEAELMLNEHFSYYMPFRLGHAFAAKGRHALAARLLEKALSPNPADQPVSYRQDIYFHIGVAHAAGGNDDAAKRAFDEALRLNPEDARALNDMGVLLEKEGHDEEALAYYRHATEVRPEFALAHSNLCDLLGRMGDHEAAIAACEAAVAAAPDSADYMYNLGVQLAAAGMTEDAIKQYRAALAVAPEDVRVLNNLALLLEDATEAETLLRRALEIKPPFSLARANLGNLYVKHGKTEQGLAVYLEGLELAPDDLELMNGLGYQYLLLGTLDKAREQFEHALEIAPDYDRARVNLVQACTLAGDLDAALEHIGFLLKKYPREVQLHADMGGLYEKKGQPQKAAACYRAVLEVDPSRDDIRHRLETLEGMPVLQQE